jgi:hypothetical protein
LTIREDEVRLRGFSGEPIWSRPSAPYPQKIAEANSNQRVVEGVQELAPELQRRVIDIPQRSRVRDGGGLEHRPERTAISPSLFDLT